MQENANGLVQRHNGIRNHRKSYANHRCVSPKRQERARVVGEDLFGSENFFAEEDEPMGAVLPFAPMDNALTHNEEGDSPPSTVKDAGEYRKTRKQSACKLMDDLLLEFSSTERISGASLTQLATIFRAVWEIFFGKGEAAVSEDNELQTLIREMREVE